MVAEQFAKYEKQEIKAEIGVAIPISTAGMILKVGIATLVGSSGGGKSTAMRLSARFWDVQEGTVTIGGVDISKIDPEVLLRSISIVFQDVTLFNNSVLENIRIGRKDATVEEVIEVAKMANCDEFKVIEK